MNKQISNFSNIALKANQSVKVKGGAGKDSVPALPTLPTEPALPEVSVAVYPTMPTLPTRPL